MFSNNLVGTTGQFNKGNSGATINYYIYYKSFMRILLIVTDKNYTTIRIHTRKANGYYVKRTLLNKVAPCQIPIKQTAKPISSKVGTKAKPSQTP